ncbi:MAG: metallophosphoesterase [Chloroflexi bacterium]|nr:metallophosphoesterase [Chloroflexota bacterium]
MALYARGGCPVVFDTGSYLDTNTETAPHPSRRRLTLLHTSDLHLGSDSFADSAFRGFELVLETATAMRVDGMLIVGDIFDSSRSPLDTVARAFRRLGELDCPVFLLPGNHDTLLTGTYGTVHGVPAPPPNAHLLREADGEMAVSEELGLSVWGRPVYNHDPSFRPLEGVRPRPSGGWYIVMAHGLVMDDHVGSFRSSPITHEELHQVDCDYVALGHVHVFRDVTHGGPSAFYSGAPSGSHYATTALVTLDPASGVTVERIALA